MFVAPAVACEISWPPTTPRGVSRSSPPACTTFMPRQPSPNPRGPAPLGGHAGELPAGDVEDLAVDEVRPRRAQEEDASGGLLRRAGAAERDQHRRHPAHLVGDAELDGLAADL